jgi:hypothetical protein
MEEETKKQEDVHITKGFTRWTHQHRRMAKWLMKGSIALVASILYYFRREEKRIEDEIDKKK